jgi:hypothetical protein
VDVPEEMSASGSSSEISSARRGCNIGAIESVSAQHILLRMRVLCWYRCQDLTHIRENRQGEGPSPMPRDVSAYASPWNEERDQSVILGWIQGCR